MLSPPKWAPVLSYTTAFWNIAGGWALIAAGAYIFASGLLGIAVAFNPDYVQQRWQLFVLYIGLLFLFFLCNVSLVPLPSLAPPLLHYLPLRSSPHFGRC